MDGDLLQATKPFALETVSTSWRHVITIFVLVVSTLIGAGFATGWLMKTVFALLSALFMVRAFITYHDFMHGAILRDSAVAKILFHIYGWFTLVPVNSWRKSHNYHHGHVGQISWDAIGAFPLVTTAMWRRASTAQRSRYRATRHPLILLFGYVTIFGFSITLLPLLREPTKHLDSALSLFVHGGLITALWLFGGFNTAFYVILLPMTLSAILGSYLFFAQHSTPAMAIFPPQSWSFSQAALRSSSYLRLGKIMQWFTGNIGYHHVHHLNVRIPFYRLPEAMAAIPSLRSPITTSLRPSDIIGCFRACLWDDARQRTVSYREASRQPKQQGSC